MMDLFEPKCDDAGREHLYGRNSILAKIHDYVVDGNMPENVALLGVKGVGKTSILKRAFFKTELKKYYDEANVLVAFVSIPDSNDSMKGFYSYLHTSILEAVDKIEEYDSSKYEAIMSQILEKKNKILSRCVEIDDATMESVLNKTIEVTKQFSLKILVVFDDFERFADSSKLKKAQYKFMRELANSDKISLFISTGQDLTKVSEEMKGSGFENIFRYEELRGIRAQDIEDWIFDVTDDTEIEFDDDLLEWIEEISGGIPEIVGEAAELSYALLTEKIEFNSDEYFKKLYPIIYPLMKKWWSYTDVVEHQIFEDIISEQDSNSVNRDCLVKKGYLNEDDDNDVCFVTPLFEMFVLEEITKDKPDTDVSALSNSEELRRLLQEIVKEANEEMAYKIEKMDTRISDITDKLSTLISELPSRDEFVSSEDGEFDADKYGAAISDYISDKLVETNEAEICEAWNIPEEVWNSFSNIRKNDCSMAYKLISYIFATDVENLDYTPVTVMLGNFLEGLLNDKVLKTLKRHMPDVRVRNKNGTYGKMSEYRGVMTIGGFEFTFRNEDVAGSICKIPKATTMGLKAGDISDFSRRLSECHKIRNKADHPGEITTYKDKNTFVNNLFKGKNSLLSVMVKLNEFS